MDLKPDYKLKPGQRQNPVVYAGRADLSGVEEPTPERMDAIFKRLGGARLQTWNRPDGKKLEVAHWIAVKGPTPMHIDPAYPRYSYHLKVMVQPGISVYGWDRSELPLSRGVFYVLDAHSPHKVEAPPGAWNVAASFDSKIYYDPKTIFPVLMAYVKANRVEDGA